MRRVGCELRLVDTVGEADLTEVRPMGSVDLLERDETDELDPGGLNSPRSP